MTESKAALTLTDIFGERNPEVNYIKEFKKYLHEEADDGEPNGRNVTHLEFVLRSRSIITDQNEDKLRAIYSDFFTQDKLDLSPALVNSIKRSFQKFNRYKY